MSAEQEARLVVLAERHHMTIPRLLVSSTLERSDQITAADKRELLVALFTIQRLLGNLANNVNQIARTANSTGELPEQTGAALTALRRAASRIDCELGRFSLS